MVCCFNWRQKEQQKQKCIEKFKAYLDNFEKPIKVQKCLLNNFAQVHKQMKKGHDAGTGASKKYTKRPPKRRKF